MSSTLLQAFRKNRGMDEDAHFPFGKHAGEKVGDVLDEYPSYIVWWDENVKEHPIQKDIVLAAEHCAGDDLSDVFFDHESWGDR